MAAPFFPPTGLDLGEPDYGFKETPNANVEETPLGDGYVFREPKGINHIKRTMPMSWSNLDQDVALEAYDWLLPKLKLNPILITHPTRGTQIQVICDSLEITYDTWNNAVLNATFIEDFNPVGT